MMILLNICVTIAFFLSGAATYAVCEALAKGYAVKKPTEEKMDELIKKIESILDKIEKS